MISLWPRLIGLLHINVIIYGLQTSTLSVGVPAGLNTDDIIYGLDLIPKGT